MNIFNLTRNELDRVLKSKHEDIKPFYSKELFRWIYKKQVCSFGDITNISNKIKELCHELFDFTESKVERVLEDKKDGVKKLLIRLKDSYAVESVIIPSEKRTTLCVSTQVGCAMGCEFCLTANMKFKRNLEAFEIVEQIRFAEKILSQEKENKSKDEHLVSNIVFMGMGEPLNNLAELEKAISILKDQYAFAYSKRRITVSTCGVADKILEIPKIGDVNVAVSLNAVNDEKRSKIMPINNKYPIKVLFEVLKKYPLDKGRRITFEYVLLKNFNDTIQDADLLIQLMKKVPSKVNLIEFNEFEGSKYQKPERKQTLAFQKRLMNAGIQCNLRESRGQNIKAACGQLIQT